MKITKRPVIIATVSTVVLSGMLVGATAYAQDNDSPIGEQIDQILDDSRLDGSQASVVVSDAESGEKIYDHGGGARAMPASVTKTLTSAAAMETLGPDHQFSTDVAAAEAPSGGTISGDVYLRGTGDPTMLESDYADLAAKLAAEKVTTVEGDLVADDTAYDSSRLGQEWAWDDEPYYYAAPVSALTIAADEDYDAGSVTVTVTPTSEGERPKAELGVDTDYVKVNNKAKTVSGGDSSISVDRAHGGNTITITGEIPADAEPEVEYMSVSEPTGLAADVFAKALKAEGITVNGDVRLGESTPEGAESLAGKKSMKLSKMLTPFLKLSNNGHAESLVKAMGRKASGEGSWEAGLSEVSDFAEKHDMDTGAFSQADGSGLSRRNLISASQFNSLLLSVRDASWYKTWHKALPIACESDPMVGGTLSSRMCDTPAAGNVHAKTGSLSGVSALGGYVTDADGREMVFSIVFNDLVTSEIGDLEDEIAVALASYSQEAESMRESVPDIPRPKGHNPGGLECSWVKPITC